MDSKSEARMLRRAVEEGLLRQETIDALLPGPPGARTRVLVRRGDLSEAVVQRLMRDADLTEITRVEVPWSPAGLPHAEDWPHPEEWGRPGEGAAPGVAGGVDWARQTAPGTQLPPADSLAFLAGWERYQIGAFLGAGGMGQVFKAYDPQLNRFVALKFLRSADPRQVERFLREARAQARVNHQHVCRVYETDQVKGHPYIAMQYIEGETLGHTVDTLTLEEKVQIVRDVAEAVHAAHRMGLIHRDLKPGNILVERREDGVLSPYVLDFGLAHDQDNLALTRSGAVTGTPSYLSPEQAQGRPLDRRGDVYSLGVVLYELLSGYLPIEGASLADALIKVVSHRPVPLGRRMPEVPRDLETITMKCLEKEPQQRYDSARALAEDLSRYLDGVPVLARPASLAYRAQKWVRRNRAVAWVLVGAVAALAILGTVSLGAYLEQGKRARLLQRFEREVADSEDEMRLASFLPLHDLGPEKDRLRARLQQIRREMDELGRVAHGPGQYALGRGHLALNDYELALDHLETAWESGERRPDVALALAEALRRLYQKALLAIDLKETGPPSPAEDRGLEVRNRHLERVERQYQRPALRYLAAGDSPEARTPYVQALIAFFSHRLDEARAKATAAAQEDRWYYDARQLLAEIAIEEADRDWARGRYEEALASFERAGAVYAELLDIGKSDPNLYAAECERLIRVNSLNAEFRRFSEAQAEQALARCDQALTADRELADAYARQAYLRWLWGTQLLRTGGDPQPQLDRAIDLAERALRSNPREALAHRSHGLANLALGRIQSDRGHDPSALLEQAEASLGKALEIQPAWAETLGTLGNVYLERADYEKGMGRDPRPMLERAVGRYRESQRVDPQDPMPWNNRGNALLTWAEFEMQEGRDPAQLLGSALADLRQAVELNPNSPRYRNNLAVAFLDQADFEAQAGKDPTAAYDQAIGTLNRAVELNPDYTTALPNLAMAYRGKAAHSMASGQDPTPALDEAREHALAALAAGGEDFDVLVELARIYRLEAEWKAQRGANLGAAIEQAESFLARAAEANPTALELHEEGARLCRVHARWALVQGRPAAALLARGLAAADRVLAAKPGSGAVLFAKAELLWLASGKGKSADKAEQVRALAARALAADPRLATEIATLQAEMGGAPPAVSPGAD